MKVDYLRYFDHLAHTMNYTKAAKDLYIAQPTLSVAIKRMEQELGFELFRRGISGGGGSSKIELTDQGKAFQEYVSLALANYDKGISVARDLSGEANSQLRLGTIYAMQGRFWSQAMAAFTESCSLNPDISIEQAYSPELVRKVQRGELDCAFAARVCDDDDLQYVLVWSQPLVLAVNRQNPLSKRKAISLEKIEGQKVIAYTRSSPAAGCIDAVEKRYNLDLDRSYDDEITMSAVVSSSPLTMALFCYSFLVNAFEDVACLRIKDFPTDAHKVYLVSRRERQTKTVQQFVDFMSQYRFPNIFEMANLQEPQTLRV